MHAADRRQALVPCAFVLAALGALGLAGRPARAEQDDVAERIPSSAADVYSPIARSFARQPALPGGPIANEPVAAEGPVLMQDVKWRLSGADPFFRDMAVNFYTRTH